MRHLPCLLLALSIGCPAPSTHGTPVYEADPEANQVQRTQRTEGNEDPQPQPPPRGAVDRPWLYTVANVDPPSYLFGTIHVGVALEEALPGDHFGAMAEPRVIMVEVDPSTITPQNLVAGARLSRRQDLENMLPSMVWHDLTAELAGVMASEGLKQMKPWFAMMMLTQERVRDMHVGRPPQAMDLAIATYAQEQGITLRPLESANDQIRALNAIPDTEMIAIVTDMMENAETANDDLREMLQFYRAGDETQMAGLIFDEAEMERSPRMYRELFTRRNEAWMRALKQELDQGGAFIAVGLGHLLGPDGLLAKLRAEGYPIERVQP